MKNPTRKRKDIILRLPPDLVIALAEKKRQTGDPTCRFILSAIRLALFADQQPGSKA